MKKSNKTIGQPTESVDHEEKLEHTKGEPFSFVTLVLFTIMVGTMVLTISALYALTDPDGPWDMVKILVLGAGAAAAGYVVNSLAIRRLAPMAAKGFTLANVVAVIGIVVMGIGLFTGTLTGMIYDSVERIVYEDHGEKLQAAISEANAAALAAERLRPAIQVVADDIGRTAVGEAKESALSRRGRGGRGPMALALEAWAGEAFGVATALDAGAVEREQLLDDLNDLHTEYLETLASEALSARERRADLQSVHGEIAQTISTLREAMPLGLVRGFAEKLQAGAVLTGDPEGGRILSAFLSKHGKTLIEQMDELPETAITVPRFPPKPGMLEVWAHIATFAGIAAVVAVAELFVPLGLYIAAYIDERWKIEQARAARAKARGLDDPEDR